ncbi:unnamed protein product, partial [Amoebophrya sp. A120]
GTKILSADSLIAKDVVSSVVIENPLPVVVPSVAQNEERSTWAGTESAEQGYCADEGRQASATLFPTLLTSNSVAVSHHLTAKDLLTTPIKDLFAKSSTFSAKMKVNSKALLTKSTSSVKNKSLVLSLSKNDQETTSSASKPAREENFENVWKKSYEKLENSIVYGTTSPNGLQHNQYAFSPTPSRDRSGARSSGRSPKWSGRGRSRTRSGSPGLKVRDASAHRTSASPTPLSPSLKQAAAFADKVSGSITSTPGSPSKSILVGGSSKNATSPTATSVRKQYFQGGPSGMKNASEERNKSADHTDLWSPPMRKVYFPSRLTTCVPVKCDEEKGPASPPSFTKKRAVHLRSRSSSVRRGAGGKNFIQLNRNGLQSSFARNSQKRSEDQGNPPVAAVGSEAPKDFIGTVHSEQRGSVESSRADEVFERSENRPPEQASPSSPTASPSRRQYSQGK